MQKICIIIPCYNEAKRLQADLIENFFTQSNYYVCFINDGSRDNTLCVLKNLKNKIGENCKILNIPKNVGKAEAVRYGFLNNMNAGFDYLGFFDADLSTPLEEIDYFIKFSGGELKHDIVIGSRFLRLGSIITRTSGRHYLGRVFATFASVLLKLHVYDTQCGAKLFSHKVYSKIFDTKFISKWLFDVELIYRSIAVFGLDYVKSNALEVPLNKWTEVKGSKLKFYNYLIAPYELFKIWYYYRNKTAKRNKA